MMPCVLRRKTMGGDVPLFQLAGFIDAMLVYEAILGRRRCNSLIFHNCSIIVFPYK